MFQIAAVAAWSGDGQSALAPGRFQRALIDAGGTGWYSQDLPGAVLGAVGYGVWGGTSRERIRVDRDAKIGVAGVWRVDNREEMVRALRWGGAANDGLILLEAYRQWGDSFPARVKGDFAGLVWDWGRRRLLGFRDRVGVRPLFYATRIDGIAVATDVDLLLSIVGDPGTPDDRMIVEYLTWNFGSVDRTFWTGLRRLPAGQVLEASADAAQVRPYWHPPEPTSVDPDAVYPLFRELFFQSVRRRLAGEEPVLAHLSGGVDSSAIVCVADCLLRTEPGRFPPVRAVSARYPGLEADEGPYIDAVTRRVSLPTDSWDGRSQEFLDLSAPSRAGPGYRNHRADETTEEFAIAERYGAVAILSGQGGDQLGVPSGLPQYLFRGRPIWFGRRVLSRDDLSWGERARLLRFLVRSIAPEPFSKWWARRRGRRNAPPWLESRWSDVISDIHGEAATRLRDFRSVVQEAHWRDLLGGAMAHALDADHRVSTRHGVDVRYPFLDHDLVDFVLKLPPERWPLPEPGARLQRRALADLLPEVVLSRTRKTGFSPVVASHLRHAAPRLRALLFDGPWASERWVSRRGAQALFERAMSAADDRDWDAWQGLRAVATLEAWLRVALVYDAPSQESAVRRKI